MLNSHFQIFQNLNLGFATAETNPPHFFVRQSDEDNSNARSFAFANPDFYQKSSGSFEVELSDVCSKLCSTDILEMLRQTITDQVPPKFCVVKSESEEIPDKLSLKYDGGIEIELRIVDKQKDSKGLKMRRISGDHLVYHQLCQQLISCMTIS